MPNGWAHNPVEGGDGGLAGGWDGYILHNDMDVDGEDREDARFIGGGLPSAAINASNAGVASSLESAVCDIEVVRHFLHDVDGVPDSILENST